MTQMDLALQADISARHLSFLETGRAQPSREMLMHLAEELGIPLRSRNELLVSAGFAPVFAQRPLTDPALHAARAAIDLVLQAQRPYPAFALDRHWNVVASNGALPQLYEGVDAALLETPVNVLRLSLHPRGLAPRIANLREWRAHLLSRLRRQIEITADPALAELMREAMSYASLREKLPDKTGDVLVPLRIETAAGTLSFLSTTTVFGTPVEVTLAELAIESFFAADEATAAAVRQI
jgi:transcriptional regulator with XRE-family HTH domain